MSTEDILARIPKHWGKYIDVGSGWLDIVVQLDKDIATLDPNYTIAQVKEKFGGLRYYIDTINPAVYTQAMHLIQQAEVKAARTCEVCGEAGTLRVNKGWYRTVCESCSTS